ncbi:hypothetical protein SCHPADRAFT_1001796 [Schizopora paradoxa]|uniref:Uncharacterized protein n=1 Tax=Schizopora paradoxa TaxID=27342 RepID=A0A0H2RR10_9AGAM|nr:hypothetical protein SCHPADRAFT_1001796 [Schizopora paradoxa]
MSWRKLSDDGKDLCCSLDYLLDGIQVLRSSIQLGRRLDGEANMKVNSRELWYDGLYRHLSGNDTSFCVNNAKMTLRRMKDARSLLSSVLKSMDEAIQTVTNGISNACRGAGLSLLPDDVLTYIFEMYVEMGVELDEHVNNINSPQTLASVSKRFRQIALSCSSLWKHVSLRFPREQLSFYKDRCPNPIIHIDTSCDLPLIKLEKFDVIPYQQWRGLRMVYNNEEEGHLYFEHLKSIVKNPLETLESLAIWNLDEEDEHDERFIPLSIYLDDNDSDTLSSWRMPNLTRLEIYNVVPMAPLQCGNVIFFSFQVLNLGDREDLNMGALCGLLQSMPKIQSLQVTLIDVDTMLDDASSIPIMLPDLVSLELLIGGSTVVPVVNRVMGVLNIEELTHLVLKFYPSSYSVEEEEQLFDGWALAVFSRSLGDVPFVKLEEFSLEAQRARGKDQTIHRMFCAMPNVYKISLVLPEDTNIRFTESMKKEGAFQRLRYLQIKLPQTWPEDFTAQLRYFGDFFRDVQCKEFERFEIEFCRPKYASPSKARLFEILGEKLRWIEC